MLLPSRTRPWLLTLALLLVVLIAGTAVTGCSIVPAALADLGGQESQPAQNTRVAATATSSIPPGLGPNTISDIVTKAGPAVVKIDTVAEVGGGYDPFFNDPFFRQFFGSPLETRPRVQEGVGSGFLITAEGYILTNQHVVDGADQIKVTVAGYDTPFQAQVVGSDYDLDLAVLKINGSQKFPYLALGDSNKVKVGEWVIAIGNPFGLDHTVTVGVISAKGRPVTIEDRNYENLLQTDASINPGNSGGPLLNLSGQVVGINTAINAEAQGIGFAIPTSTVQGVLQTLIAKGQVVRPWLGVAVYDLTPDLAEELGVAKAEGALVLRVESNSPAARAGLRQGDIIIAFGGQKIANADDLVKAIQQSKIGQQVSASVYRLGRTLKIAVTIAQKPSKS